MAHGLSGRDYATKVISYRDQLYVFPPFRLAERYDPTFNGWCTLDLSVTRSTNVAVARGEMYATEVNTSMKKSTIKRYNAERCLWQTVLSSREGCREDSCFVVAGNHLYVCGGRINDEYVTKAERFKTVENKWEEIANMQQKTGYAFSVATEGKIFLAGERKSDGMFEKYLQTCEMYTVFTNEWQFIGSLDVSRAYGSMVCLKGTFYVLGGTGDFNQRELSVECYDSKEDKWIRKTTIPVKIISKGNNDTFKGCVLKQNMNVQNMNQMSRRPVQNMKNASRRRRGGE